MTDRSIKGYWFENIFGTLALRAGFFYGPQGNKVFLPSAN
jgi:hypothetical protein